LLVALITAVIIAAVAALGTAVKTAFVNFVSVAF
jgi:Flp pilus assembly pilin Flp